MKKLSYVSILMLLVTYNSFAITHNSNTQDYTLVQRLSIKVFCTFSPFVEGVNYCSGTSPNNPNTSNNVTINPSMQAPAATTSPTTTIPVIDTPTTNTNTSTGDGTTTDPLLPDAPVCVLPQVLDGATNTCI